MADPRLDILKRTNEETERQINLINGVSAAEKNNAIITQQIYDIQKLITQLTKEQNQDGKDHSITLGELRKQQGDLNAELEKTNKKLEKGNTFRKNSIDLTKQLVAHLKMGWNYLQEQDKLIKTTNLNLGLSGAKAASMRESFMGSKAEVLRMGGSLADIQTIMQGFADETGRANVLTSQMVIDIESIGKGTGLGIQEATKLGAQFEYMGLNASATVDYVQGVVDTSERMGVNTTKVLKNISDNFRKLNQYTFQQGVKGILI